EFVSPGWEAGDQGASVTSVPKEAHLSPSSARRAQMHDALQGAYTHGGMALLVHGNAGMGKSTMLRELAQKALADETWGVCFVNADEGEQSEPYSFVERLLAAGIGSTSGFTPDESTQPAPVAQRVLREMQAQ